MTLGLSATGNSHSTRLERELAQIRAGHPPRRLRRRGVDWRYLVGGAGRETILRLTGALGVAEFSFQQIALFEPHFRVITPDYPTVASLVEMTEGLLAILEAERADLVHVIGGSFGGMLAQALVRAAPDRFASLILSHTGAPDGRGRRLGLALVSVCPGSVLRRLLEARLGRTLAAADVFWQRYFHSAMGILTKADIISRARLQAEFARQEWIAGDLASWPGRVLILEGEDDPLFKARERARLRALYPSAESYTFHGTGHAAALLKPEEYVRVVTTFISQRSV
jgi:pimeloyl-ACP methyl ester carboxylesterase